MISYTQQSPSKCSLSNWYYTVVKFIPNRKSKGGIIFSICIIYSSAYYVTFLGDNGD